jgi:beta-glucosidase-like glycosyl hydrolase
MHNTTLGIPTVFQSKGTHRYINNGTIFPSLLGKTSSFNTDLLYQAATAFGREAQGTRVKQFFILTVFPIYLVSSAGVVLRRTLARVRNL